MKDLYIMPAPKNNTNAQKGLLKLDTSIAFRLSKKDKAILKNIAIIENISLSDLIVKTIKKEYPHYF